MKKFVSQYFFLLSSAALAVIMALVFWFGIRPLSEKITEVRNEIQKFHADRENRTRQLARLSEFRAQFEAISRDEGTLDILLTDDEIVDFIRLVERQAEEARVEITIAARDQAGAIVEKGAPSKKAKENEKASQVTLEETIPFDRYLPLSIEVRGDYQAIRLFLHKLETLPIALDVMSVELKPSTEEAPAALNPGTAVNPFFGEPGTAASSESLTLSGELLGTIEVFVYTDKKQE